MHVRVHARNMLLFFQLKNRNRPEKAKFWDNFVFDRMYAINRRNKIYRMSFRLTVRYDFKLFHMIFF